MDEDDKWLAEDYLLESKKDDSEDPDFDSIMYYLQLLKEYDEELGLE